MEPQTTVVNVGDTVEMNLNVKNAVDLYGYQLSVNYDPSALSPAAVTDGGF